MLAQPILRFVILLAALFQTVLADGAAWLSKVEDAVPAEPAVAKVPVRSTREQAQEYFGGREKWEALPAAERDRILTLFDTFDAAVADGDESLMIEAMADYVKAGLPGRYRTSTAVDVAKRLAAKDRADEALELLQLIGPGEPDASRARLTEAHVLHGAGRSDEALGILKTLPPPDAPVRGNYGESADLADAAKLMARLGEHERARQYYIAAKPADDPLSRRLYLFNGQTVATELEFFGDRPAEAVNFLGTLVKKYPEDAGPQQLDSLQHMSRSLAGDREATADSRQRYRAIADAASEALLSQYPNSREAFFHRLGRIDQAVDAKDVALAERELAAAAKNFDALSPLHRADLRQRADRVRAKGGAVPKVMTAGGDSVVPVPDAAFPPAAEAPPGR